MKLSRRARSVKPSATLATAAKARAARAAGADVVDFGTGEPDFDTPAHIKAAACRALDEGFVKYPPLGGIPELKAAISRRMASDHGLEYGPDRILVSVGAKQAIYNLCQAVLDDGDEAILVAPYWVSYPDQVRLAGGEPVVVKTTADHAFAPRPEDLEAAITERTRLLFLNSPSNPSGAVYSREALEGVAEVVRRHPGLVVMSDDIYEQIVFDGEFRNLLMVAPDLADRTLIVNGVSKGYAMTGWRIGWACGPQPLIAAMQRIQGQSTSGATSFAQRGAVAALEGDQGVVREMVAQFKRRRDHVVERLRAIDGLGCGLPGGAFYAFPDVRGILERRYQGEPVGSSGRLAELLIEEKWLAVVDGAPFGADGFLRISYATSMEQLDKGLDRLAEFVSELD